MIVYSTPAEAMNAATATSVEIPIPGWTTVHSRLFVPIPSRDPGIPQQLITFYDHPPNQLSTIHEMLRPFKDEVLDVTTCMSLSLPVNAYEPDNLNHS